MKRFGFFAAFGASALGLVTPALAQDRSATPNYGTVRLNPGFSNDPYIVNVNSGGTIEATGISGDCRGYISNAPDVRLNYGSGSGTLPLIIGAQSDYDTTLVINAPDGSWYCDDDRGAGVDPLIRFHQPMAGQYAIWVGTYGGSDNYEASLVITERESSLPDDEAVDTSGPQPMPNPGGGTYGSVSLSGGFSPDPYMVRVQSGGDYAASNFSSDCTGYIASNPDFQLNYRASSFPLYISADAMADTTLVVRAPNGRYYCDDDSGEGNNPRVWMETPMSGQYDIWVGTYGNSEMHAAELNISELYSE
ncbi:peptidase [Aurantiacibacter arachoides]|uniref:peptidase n=1 Tax=Aurantiacibacter arachoides TaxID=1850444 RepID=UPI0016669D6D|nr:peptidase [Aurantiacibacter arachoides]GGD51384.1 hypothetical protein GCM10011411_09030 [Aurantiacibacter arachoides]